MEVEGATTTIYIGEHFEWSGATSTMKKHYYAESQHLGARTGTGTGNTGLIYTIPDHLGSTVATVDAATLANTHIRYYPWGEMRPSESSQATDRLYTGQVWDSYINMYWYSSRWYDPQLGRFSQPDTLVPSPNDPLSWDRYSYVRNNSLRYSDPSGHYLCDEQGGENCNPDKSTHINNSTRITPSAGNPHAFKRIQIPNDVLRIIGLTAYAETNGDYPYRQTRLIIWSLFNRYSASVFGMKINVQSAAITELAKNLAIRTGIPFTVDNQVLAAQEILDYYTNNINEKFERILTWTQAIYESEWLNNKPDPTMGSIYFSVSGSLERTWNGRIIVEFNDHDELYNWLVDNFIYYLDINPDFSFLITPPFEWNVYGQLGVLVLGNDLCVPESRCGAR